MMLPSQNKRSLFRCFLAAMALVIVVGIGTVGYVIDRDEQSARRGRATLELWAAVSQSDSRAVREALDKCADPNRQTANGYSAIRMAEEMKLTEIAAMLKRRSD